MLKSQRQELFAQGLVQGKSQEQAYIDAGYSSASAVTAASRLSTNVKVRERVAEMQNRAAERAEITASQIIDRLMGIADRCEDAEGTGSLGVAVKALVEAAKVGGLVTVKSEATVRSESSFDKMSSQERRAEIAQLQAEIAELDAIDD